MIIIGGRFTEVAGQPRVNLARLTSDGQLDSSFAEGTDGPVYRMLRQPDGKVLVIGEFTTLQGVARHKIGRLLTNGVVDLDFDAGSVIGAYQGGIGLALQPDGKILLSTTVFPFTHSALFRLNQDGQQDSGFVQTNLFSLWHILSICPRADGSILLGGGFQKVNGLSSPGLAVLKTNGELDLNFSSPLNTNSSDYDYPTVAAILDLPNQGFLIGGRFWKKGSTNRQAVAKLTPELEWDSSFQPDSFDPTLQLPDFGSVFSALRQPDGKFVLAGTFQEVGGYWRYNVVRLDADGHVDPCFDPGLGLSGHSPGGAHAMVRQPDGKILAGGLFLGDAIYTNVVRLLPESHCDNMRVYLRTFPDDTFFVGATFPPGGTNTIQISSNLVDWIDYDATTFPYLRYPKFENSNVSSISQIFVRGKKHY